MAEQFAGQVEGQGGQAQKLWQCGKCGRQLVERSEEVLRRQHELQVARACGRRSGWQFVADAMWPAYRASLKRCRCGSRQGLKPVRVGSRRQLEFTTDALVAS